MTATEATPSAEVRHVEEPPASEQLAQCATKARHRASRLFGQAMANQQIADLYEMGEGDFGSFPPSDTMRPKPRK